MNIYRQTSAAFSIIEVLIGIFVFSLWLVSIYALLASSLNINEYNKNSIIASNLAREQLELFRSIRDTNYTSLKIWNQQNPEEVYSPSVKLFTPWEYYIFENDFLTGEVIVNMLGTTISESKSEVLAMKSEYGLCLSIDNVYTYNCSWPNRDTPFMRYLYIENAKDDTGNDIIDAFLITSKVIWFKRWYHEYEIQTIITDWRRI